MTSIIHQTDLAQTIDLAAERARYDECAKKLLTYKAVVAWILKSCTKEFSQYSVKFICENCLKGNIEVSSRAVHQDQPDHTGISVSYKRFLLLRKNDIRTVWDCLYRRTL